MTAAYSTASSPVNPVPAGGLTFIPQDRGPVAQAIIYARKPALWRRLVRAARARIERAFGPSET